MKGEKGKVKSSEGVGTLREEVGVQHSGLLFTFHFSPFTAFLERRVLVVPVGSFKQGLTSSVVTGGG